MQAGTSDDAGVVEVHLLGVPLGIRQRALEHAEEVRREVALIVTGGTSPELAALIARMTHLGVDVPEAYQRLASGLRAQLDEATAAGRASADVHCQVTGEVVAAVTAMEELFERLNDLSRAEKLLTLAVPEELGAFRRWLLGQYTSQYKGEPPVPWPQWAAALGLDLAADGAEDVDD